MSLLKNSWLNLLGLAIPSLIAIPSMGYMARELEREIFGLFTLAITFIGYSVIFDGGLSRAVIREISMHRDDPSEARLIIGSAARISLVFGLIIAVVIASTSTNIADVLNVTKAHKADAASGLIILALCVPLVLLNAILMGLLEGREDFRSVNAIRAIGFSLVFLVPPLLTIFNQNFKILATGILIARLLTLLLTYQLFFRSSKFHPTSFSKPTLVRLYKFGGWLTVSNIVSPIMEYFDRFIIAGMSGSSSVIYYTAPAELNSRLLSIPGAISRALFPAASNRASTERRSLVLRALFYQTIITSTITLTIFSFSEIILKFWLGDDFARESSNILLFLTIGFFFNGLATIPFTHLQASGKAKLTAIIHLIEIGPYFLILATLTDRFGLAGAAFAWSTRVAVDFALMLYFSIRNLPNKHHR